MEDFDDENFYEEDMDFLEENQTDEQLILEENQTDEQLINEEELYFLKTASESDSSSDEEESLDFLPIEEKEEGVSLLVKKKKYDFIVESLSIDSEFTTTQNKNCISVQGLFTCTFKKKEKLIVIMVINELYKNDLLEEVRLKQISEKKETYIVYDFFTDLDKPVILNYFLQYLKQIDFLKFLSEKTFTKLFCYYSLKDFTYAFGIENMISYYENVNKGPFYMLKQKRNITGKILIRFMYDRIFYDFVFKIYDLYGLGQRGGLKKLAESVGLKKLDLLDNFKANMDYAIIQKPFEFIEYAIKDVLLLPQIYFIKLENFNLISFSLGIKQPVFIHDMPVTIGSITHKIWLHYYFHVVFKSSKILFLANVKMNVLNKLHYNYTDNLKYFNEISSFKSFSDFERYCLNNLDWTNNMYYLFSKKKVFQYQSYQYASINFLLNEKQNDFMALLGLTSGGRTVNEKPNELIINHGADVDIQSAYGTTLEKALYPIGKPRMYLSTPNNKSITLKKFLNKYKEDLCENLCKIVVSGKLTFHQDLIFSKLVTSSFYEKQDKEDQTPSVPFVLLRKEIYNGSITLPMLNIIEKVSSNQEWNEIMNLKVESAIFWLKSDQVFSIEELMINYMKSKGNYKFDEKINVIKDNRTFAWYGVPIKNIVSSIIKARLELKKLKDSVSFAKQESMKLFVNTLWGVMTSAYFDINNVVVSEFVTSSIRVSVWLISKALNTHISITDGGPYSLTRVTKIKDSSAKLPSLDTLSIYSFSFLENNKLKVKGYKHHRNIEFGNLADIDWENNFYLKKSYKEFPFIDLDKFAMDHLQAFWLPYNINFKENFGYVLEHKLEKTFIKAAYILKAHYAFYVWNDNSQNYDNFYYKIRGFRYDNSLQHLNPIYFLLQSVLNMSLDTSFYIPNNGTYEQKKLLKLAAWRRSLIMDTITKKKIFKDNSTLLPGDDFITLHSFRLNNLHFPLEFLEDYKRKAKRAFRNTKDINGKKIKMPLFEKYLKHNPEIMLNQMIWDDLRKNF